jgi:hypothetical protein
MAGPQRRCCADGGAQAGVASRFELVELGSSTGTEPLRERSYGVSTLMLGA